MEIPGDGGNIVKPPGTENPWGRGQNRNRGYGYFPEPHNESS